MSKLLPETNKATKGLAKVGLDLVKTVEGFKTFLIEDTERLSDEITTMTSELEGLKENYGAKFRQADIDLKLRVQEAEDATVATVLEARGQVAVTSDTLLELKAAATLSIEKQDKQIAQAVSDAVGARVNAYETSIAEINADHKVEVAETNTKVVSLEVKIEFLEASNKSSQDAITAERQARVDILTTVSQRF